MLPVINSIINYTIPKKCLCGDKFSDTQGEICAECFSDIKFSTEINCCPACSFPFEYEMGKNVLCSDCINESPDFDHLKFVFVNLLEK